jgi:hypothetical protein
MGKTLIRLGVILSCMLMGCTYKTESDMEFDEDTDGPKKRSEGLGRYIADMVTGVSASRNIIQNEWNDAKVRTLAFNLTFVPGVDGGGHPLITPQCEALIVFSVEGNNVTRRVSVVNGMAISGVAQALNVTLEDHTNPGSPFPLLGQSYSVDIIESPGSRAFGHQPPFLQQQPTVKALATGTSTTFLVPNDAGASSVYVAVIDTVTNPALGQIVVQHQAGTSGFNIRNEYDPRQYPSWVPLAPGTTQIFVQNNGPDTIGVTCILGIDG